MHTYMLIASKEFAKIIGSLTTPVCVDLPIMNDYTFFYGRSTSALGRGHVPDDTCELAPASGFS